MTGASPTILVLGTAEWSSPIATNQHYVVRELARAYDTHFVESLGLRRPRVDARDLGRMAQRLRNSIRGQTTTAYRPIPERAKIISPLVVPLHRAPTRVPNRLLLERAVTQWRRGPRPRILWTFTPVTYDLERYADCTLYHCVDIYQAFPGIDAVAVGAGERRLATRATMAIATSDGVAEHLAGVAFPRVRTLPNVADVDVFSAAARPAARRRPAAIFAGNLSPHKLDTNLLRALATALRGRGDLLLAGPVATGFAAELAELQRLGAKYLGVLKLDRLAEVVGECTIGLIPYARNGYTAGVSPLKCYEYLAGGVGVVSTAIPEVVRVAGETSLVEVAGDTDDFVARVLAAIDPGADEDIHARTGYARNFGWEHRGEVLREIVARAVDQGAEDAHV
ncbi:glycosyltransferase [Rhizomonospora bruguierae]|uniref:glycosyltransferase n=1 Tax=Rhizomonospora bruguierae TaxID=1581705 RepID=UPI0020BFCE04|nr:glycosyltransferase [Micromonospora sp. NBRC 107566]